MKVWYENNNCDSNRKSGDRNCPDVLGINHIVELMVEEFSNFSGEEKT